MNKRKKFNWCLTLSALSLLWLAAPGPFLRGADKPGSSDSDVFSHLKFRNLGPAVAGGRVSSVAGIPGNPNVYYVGAAGGGVFKTTDGGNSWKAIFTGQKTASIGALALAPSNPNLVWVGTGEANIRNDITDGSGLYFSPDAGKTWELAGLQDAGQIGRILIDPTDPNRVFVAALGHAWGPNVQRGLFRSIDGGNTWQKVLFVNDSTGCIDIVMEPDNPMVLLAAMWQVRRYPWGLEDGGQGSGIFRSLDGGSTWTRLTKDLPEGPLGRIALAIPRTAPHHVYALIEAKKGMLWESNDLGDSWDSVTDNHALDVRPFYFSQIVVSPVNARKVYFLSFQMMVSENGGKTVRVADRGVHPDHHALWIDPSNPDRMLQGNDGGVFLTTDGGDSWRFLDNLPIEQFYMVAADTKTPYGLCGGLQDNSAWCGPSNSLSGSRIVGSDWFVVTGGDGEYAVPAPSDPNIIYADSQNGSIRRLDLKTHVSSSARPYLEGVDDVKPSELKYRFNWTSPIAVSPTNADGVYLGANVLFKSSDGGAHWRAISQDLTRNDKSKQGNSGGPVQFDISGAETYDTILSITVAPTDPKVIWVGTDDGLVQLTRDGGKNWTDVSRTISGAPQWARVYQLGVSPFDAGTAYVAFDAHMLDNRKAYAFKTTDFGHSWQSISEGLPGDTPVRVIREDPNRKGLLVAGTDSGLFYSPDAGRNWHPLKANFPTAPVWDLKFVKKEHDLVVATHGRGLFVLDDIRPLEELDEATRQSDFRLFSTAPGVIFHRWNRGGFGAAGLSVPNPPTGVILDYFLKTDLEVKPAMKRKHQTPVKISITDAKGNHVVTHYGPAKAGVNRFVWNMRYEGPSRLRFEREASSGGFFNRRSGPLVLPGKYQVAVTVSGKTQTRTVEVDQDPHLKFDPAVLREQLRAALTQRNDLNALNEVLNQIDGMQKTLASVRAQAGSREDSEENSAGDLASVSSEARALGKKLKDLKDSLYNSEEQHGAPEDDIHYLSRFHSRFQGLSFSLIFSYGQPVREVVREEMKRMETELHQYIDQFNELLKTDVRRYNKTAYENGAPTVFVGKPLAIQAVKLP